MDLTFYKRKKLAFLINIIKLSITAYGGPQIHFTMFHKQLVQKKQFITEEELKEINSFCSMLPGPTSTQTISAIAYKLGGASLAYLTLFIWALPGTVLMICAAIVINKYALDHPKLDFLKYLVPMAVGFMLYASYRYTKLFINKSYHWYILIFSSIVASILSTPYFIPIILLVGGSISSYKNTRGQIKKPEPIKNINYGNLLLWICVLITAIIIGAITKNKIALMFENMYRYGSIVFGGGQVLVPMIYGHFVEFKHYLSGNEFLAGVGLVQAIPGPVFSIAAFTGAAATKELGITMQFISGAFCSIAIFLPGLFLLFFVFPIWEQLKNFPPVKNAIEGINAASAGLVISSAYLLFLQININQQNMLVLLFTLFLLLSTKVPSPVIVAACIAAGFIF
ncbi:MAG: chromate efflux transporter [Bacteroidia bacterium]